MKNNKKSEIYDSEHLSHYMRRVPDTPGRRPFGPDEGPPFGPPFGPPGGGQQRPMGPPPRFTPERRASTFAVDPGSIRRCLYSFVYIWPNRGRGFWAFPVFVGRKSISGFRWTGFNWVYFGMDLRNIDSFVCF